MCCGFMSGAIIMPEFIDMLALPYAGRTDAHLVGWRNQEAVSNARFKAEAAAWQSLLHAHEGCSFALYMQDSISFAAALFGAWQADKVIYLPSDTLNETCTNLANEVDGFIGEFEQAWQPLQLPDLAAIPAGNPVLQTQQRLDGSSVALVVYTSGSTGKAQAIPKKLSQMSSEGATLEALFGARMAASEVVSTVSHQHIYGLLFKVLWPICAGRAIHAHSAFFPEDLAAIAPQRPWLLLSSPAHLKRLPESPVQPDITHLQAIFSSGGPLFPDVAAATHQQFGHSPIEIYGSSETGGIAWRQPLPGIERDDRWQPMPHVEVRLNIEHDCLEVRSPHLPDSDWLRMADRVEFSDGQKFTLRGRADRIVKLEEKRISLDQIERLLLTSPLAAEARVMLHQAPGQRDRIAAFVVLAAAGRDVLEQQGKLALNTKLRAVLADAIESVALPRMWRYLDAMPANTQGKTTLAALAALLEEPQVPTSTSSRPLLPDHTLIQRTDTQVTLQLHIPENLLYFEGHFPEAPILPGVAQVNWALELGRQYLPLPPDCVGMQALKFQRVIVPGATVSLELEHDMQKSALAFRLHSADGQHASGRILLGGVA